MWGLSSTLVPDQAKWGKKDKPLFLSTCKTEMEESNVSYVLSTCYMKPIMYWKKKYCCCAVSKWNTLAFPNSELAPQNGDKSLKKSASFLTWLSQCRHFCGKNDAGYLKFFCFLMICIPNSANYSICFSASKQNRRNFMNNLYQTNTR